MKEKTDLKKLATYLWGLIPYHKIVHNKQVPVQKCPDCLSLVGARLDYQRGREDEAIGQKDMERVVEETRREVVEEIRDWIEQNRDERPDRLFSTDSKGGNYELGRRDENIVLINELVKILDKLALSSDGEKRGKE